MSNLQFIKTMKVLILIERAEIGRTMFIAWMETNKAVPEGKNLTYAEFPTKFVWKEQCSAWASRKQGFAIGRLSHVPNCNGEDYYLRLLLNIQKGCMDFKDIRTVNGTTYDSLKDACFTLELLQDDREFRHDQRSKYMGFSFLHQKTFCDLAYF